MVPIWISNFYGGADACTNEGFMQPGGLSAANNPLLPPFNDSYIFEDEGDDTPARDDEDDEDQDPEQTLQGPPHLGHLPSLSQHSLQHPPHIPLYTPPHIPPHIPPQHDLFSASQTATHVCQPSILPNFNAHRQPPLAPPQQCISAFSIAAAAAGGQGSTQSHAHPSVPADKLNCHLTDPTYVVCIHTHIYMCCLNYVLDEGTTN